MKAIRTASLLILLACFSQVYGQITETEGKLKKQSTDTIDGWKNGGVLGLNLSQTSLTNWAAGGENSLSVNGLFSVFAKYKKGKSAWDNSLDLGYGLLKQGKEGDYMKTDDKVDFLSKYGQQAFNKNLYYSVLFNFKTQMTEGKDYATDTSKISNFLAPAYILGAIGFDYKPDNYFSAFAAPFTGKITLVKDKQLSDAGAFGVDSGKTSKVEFGGYIRLIYSRNDFKSELLKNVSFTTKIDLFSNYLKNPDCIDVNWETQIALKVNKYISVNLNTQLMYDDDIRFEVVENGVTKMVPKTQFKEILGVGFSYNF